MCTASWLKSEKRFDLFFNRDEARTRGEAIPPAIQTHRGVSFIAPRDADFGGTWVAVNEFGLVLCLLNNYQSAASLFKDFFGKFTSRGEIIPALIGNPDLESCRAGAQKIDAQKYRPFVLAAFHGPSAFACSWDGKDARFTGQPELPLISSAFSYADAKKNRAGLFAAADPLSVEKMLALHRSHLPEKGELSICMHRAEAHTVSLTHVAVVEDAATMEYFAGQPCEATASVVVRLKRRR